MSLWYDSPACAVFHGDVLETLRGFKAGVFNCCVTSPPYWGLRDYKADGQIGLEKTPEEYVAKLVEVFREVRRTMRDDGTLWLNLGDSYSRAPEKGGSGPNGKHDYVPSYGDARRIMSESRGSSDGRVGRGDRAAVRNGCNGLKPKDLVGIPWLVAFALRADGWYLRQDIIWAKPNAMPESVRDRCTKSHEYLFLLAKSERYYYDSDAIKEDCVAGDRDSTFTNGKTATHQLGRASGNKRHKCVAAYEASDSEELRTKAGLLKISDTAYARRNKRDVWSVSTSPFPEAHFATFPPKLIEPCILAGSPPFGLVLDPFAGSGTTLAVAKSLSRRAIGIELQADYLPMIQRRIEAIEIKTAV